MYNFDNLTAEVHDISQQLTSLEDTYHNDAAQKRHLNLTMHAIALMQNRLIHLETSVATLIPDYAIPTTVAPIDNLRVPPHLYDCLPRSLYHPTFANQSLASLSGTFSSSSGATRRVSDGDPATHNETAEP